jgi:Rps23 Pro-64 3,4-dihydroxylase Tpa1-like proline 4-hydroxylase
MDIQNFIQAYDSVLPEKPFNHFIKYCNIINFEKSKVVKKNQGSEENFNIRRTYIKNLSNRSPSMTETHWTNVLLSRFNIIFSNYLEKFAPDSDVIIRDIAVLKYETNGFYNWHADHCKEAPRTLSAIYMLNNNYEGGNLCFKFGDKEKVMDVVPNRIIVWPSNFLYYHTVKPVTKGTRYSVVSWAL